MVKQDFSACEQRARPRVQGPSQSSHEGLERTTGSEALGVVILSMDIGMAAIGMDIGKNYHLQTSF